jgi:xylan 1,4-beta-xylosidase
MITKPLYERKNLDAAFPFSLNDIPLKVFEMHWHKSIEVIYVINGTMSAHIEGQTYTVARHDILIINSDAIHGFSDVFGSDTRMVVFQLGLSLFDSLLGDLRDPVTGDLVFAHQPFISHITDGRIHRHIEKCLLGICAEHSAQGPGYRLVIKSQLYDIAAIYLRDIPPAPAPTTPPRRQSFNRKRLERLLSFVADNYTNPDLTLDTAAQIACLSKYYFTRFFMAHTGQTFHEYLSKVRVGRAAEELTETAFSVTEIAYDCGCASLKTFNRIFKTYTGCSPTQYRIDHAKKRNF